MLKIGFPSLFSVFMLIYAAFGLYVPYFEKALLQKRRELVKNMVNVPISSLYARQKEVDDGVTTLEDAKKKAMARFQQLRYGSENKDYFWILDTTPHLLMHPYRKDLIGIDISGFKEASGAGLFVEMVNITKRSETHDGYIEYDWQFYDNPNRIERKVSYLKLFEPWGWIIGTGVYVDDIYQEINALKKSLYWISILLIGLNIVCVFLLAYQSYHSENQRDKKENDLLKSQTYNRSLFEEAPDAIMLIKGKEIIDCNKRTLNLLGYSKDEILGKSPLDFSPETQPTNSLKSEKLAIEYIENARKGGTSQFEWRHMRKDGSSVDVEVRLVTVEIEQEKLSLSFIRDITERRIIEAKLKSERDFVQTLIQSAPAYIVLTTPEGIIRQINPAFLKAIEYTADEILGKNYKNFLVPESENSRIDQKIISLRNSFESGEHTPINLSLSIKARDGNELLVLWTNKIMMVDNELLVLSMGVDITEIRKLEEHLRQAQKMDALGQLASGIAHDFNNVLAGIMGTAELLKMKNLVLPDGERIVHTIIDAAEKAAGVTARLLSFARKSDIENVHFDLHMIIVDAIRLLQSGISPSIKVLKELDAESSYVVGDPNLIENTILNLGVNARDAMTNGGVIRIKTSNIILDSQSIASRGLNMPEGKYIEIRIIDNGCGMSPKTLQRIFEPFYTTKASGKGTGLGLSSAYGIIEEHKGTIKVYSELGMGTEFIILLPCSDGQNKIYYTIPKVVAGGAESVMIIEDEDLIRESITNNLRNVGYKVAAFANGIDTLDYYRDNIGNIDIVILDMTMPGMNGREVFYGIKGINPEARIIVSSGFTNEDVIKMMFDDGLDDFIKKPFRFAELNEKIRKIIDSGKENNLENIIPVKSDKPSQLNYPDCERINKNLQKKAVIVEDDKVISGLIKDVLTDRGYTVDVFNNFGDADEKISKTDAKLLIIDWNIHGGDGLELCRKISAEDEQSECFIMMITGRSSIFEVQTALQHGVNDYLIKPFTMDLFSVRLNVAESHMENSRKRIEAEKALQEINKNLEEKVNSRTTELIAKTMDLQNEISQREEMKRKFESQKEQLAQADKMAALGVLVSCLAHEVNNPNSFISINASLLQEIWAEISPVLLGFASEQSLENIGKYKLSFIKERVPVIISGINDGSDRIKRLIDELKNFSRKRDVDYNELIDISDIIAKTEQIIGSKIKKSTSSFSVNIAKTDLPLIKGNSQALEQVLINLLLNSCDSISRKDQRITIEVDTLPATEELQLKVIDDGCGMDKDTLDHATEPFYTTKKDLAGTGLGLSISKDILTRHNAKMEIISSPGKGTTITIIFPTVKESKNEKS